MHFDNVRTMNSNSFRNSGGVSVFIKSQLLKAVTIVIVHEHLKHVIVLLVTFSVMRHSKYLIIYCTYLRDPLLMMTIPMNIME